mmetsp:Transcript_62984/g.73671  ORF Transcript_62984/g.73671 Transcript_62984/m.73671 type:complete len:82 (-) Transcript_62984:2398-2643(-)
MCFKSSIAPSRILQKKLCCFYQTKYLWGVDMTHFKRYHQSPYACKACVYKAASILDDCILDSYDNLFFSYFVKFKFLRKTF